MFAAQFGQRFAGGESEFGRERLQKYRHQVADEDDPQQTVAKA